MDPAITIIVKEGFTFKVLEFKIIKVLIDVHTI